MPTNATKKPDARELIFEIHKRDGIPGIGKLPGLWERTLDSRWKFWVNGHMETLKTLGKETPVHPGDCYVEFNGWPAGIFSLITGEGVICAGTEGNYENFCKALRAAVKEAPDAKERGDGR